MHPTPVQFTNDRDCRDYYDDRFRAGYMDAWPPHKLDRVRQIVRELNLPATGTAVDFGCGTGVFTRIIREVLAGWRVVGLDISPQAVDQARSVIPDGEFYDLQDPAALTIRADFLFTHHVLEHVRDLQASWQQMTGLTGPSSRMLHILPCGNEGSFEHELCRLRAGGIDAKAGNRFFFEDEGHLRRLTTNDLTNLAAQSRFRLVAEHYSHHDVEAVNWLTDNGLRFVLDLCDPKRAVDATAGRQLKRIRRRLLPLTLAKTIVRRSEAASPLGRWLYWPARAIARRPVERLRRRADEEWQQMRSRPNGSEMYLVFRRDEG